MKNFAKKSFVEKKTWGVLGKIQEFYSPEQFQDESRIVPLNANPLEAWDSTRSRYRRRVQGPLPNDFQQAGVVPQGTPSPDVTPTPTPSITPSSTPAFPVPALWYDATNLGSIDYISSGGTDYVATWRSIGTYQKSLTGLTTDTMPIWSGSSQFPDTPLVVRFTKNATAALRDYLSQRYDMTPIPQQSGITVFQVIANPVGGNYVLGGAAQFQFPLQIISGQTTGAFPSPIAYNNLIAIGAVANGVSYNVNINGVPVSNQFTGLSGYALNEKFLFSQTLPYDSGIANWKINETTGTLLNPITSTTDSPLNSVSMGQITTSTGVVSTNYNAGAEVGEILIYNTILSPAEISSVETYLKTKWKYDQWIPPTPTPTVTPTITPTETVTPTVTPTSTLTPTPSITPSPSVPASGTTEALAYLDKVVESGGTVDATASAATITLFTSLVSNNLWDKMYAFYPVLGGVDTAHAINGKAWPDNTLTFNGGWTHSADGMQPNGTNGYADTGFNPAFSIGNGNSSSLGLYVNLQGTVGNRIYDMGVATDAGSLTDMWNLTAKRVAGSGDNTLFDAGDYPGGRVETTSQSSASGMTIGSVRSTTDRVLYRDGSSIATKTSSQAIEYANRTQIIGAQKGAAIGFYSSNRYAFAFMASGLTNTEIVNLSNIINTYQTSLGRNTY